MSSEGRWDQVLKLLIIGDSGVGKSSILLRFTDDEFDDEQACTIGVDFKTKVMNVDGKAINLTIWDTAGQEKFNALTSSYYRGTQGIILVYDVTRKNTFEHLTHWLNEIDLYCNSNPAVILLVGNKVDISNIREVSKEEGFEYARSKAMLYIECSAKAQIGIQQAFEELVTKVLENREDDQQSRNNNNGQNVVLGDSDSQSNEDSVCSYC
eukprot:TRINITY_DN71_c0_g1_i1.p2 TRINITY_DN71_c0_g1~~TRINITY_DN71_c0_g1_i1.p2  ORF type:complete len:210 (-),score=48.33 TRINITY_DN71_c0_g1_i1:706-1335(-)